MWRTTLFPHVFTFAAISGLYQFLMLSANSVLPSLTAQESLPWSVLYPHGIIPFVEVGIGYTIISASPDLNFFDHFIDASANVNA